MRRPFRAGVCVQMDFRTCDGVSRTAITRLCEASSGKLVLQAPVGPNGPLPIDPGSKVTLWRYIGAETYLAVVTVMDTEPATPPLLITTAPAVQEEPTRRGYYRVPTRLPVACDRLVGETRDLSGSGALVAFPPGSVICGQTLHISFPVPGITAPVNVQARVARLTREPNEDLAGLNFDAMTEQVRDGIVRYVSRRQLDLMKEGDLGKPWKRSMGPLQESWTRRQ